MKKAFAILVVLALLTMPCVVLAEENYINSDTYLSNGTNDYALDTAYEYTVFTLEPTAIGTYYIACEAAPIGIVSYNGMWITIDPSDETVKENVVSWNCTDVGQSIWIAVKSVSDSTSITVSDKELIIVEIPKEEYVNKANVSKFTFEGDADALTYVDTEDDNVDSAVLGDDGLYHLNSKNGPVLYVDLDDPLMNLQDALSYGQIKSVVYDGDKVVKVIDYNNAFTKYLNAADTDTLLYPLTEDLMTIYKNVGAYQNWYGEEGWVGGTEEDAWMFACYYDENYVDPSQIVLGDVNANGEIEKYDYIAVKRAVMKTLTLTDDQLKIADVNGKDGVEKYDYILIKRHVMKTFVIGG